MDYLETFNVSRKLLFGIAYRMLGSVHDAEDIVQETLIKVWNNRETWEEIESIEAFCYTICRNLSLDSIKRHDNQNSQLDSTGGDAPDSAYNPYEDIIHKDRMSVVKKIVDELPEKQRFCMQLRDFEGKAYKDIANVLEITEEQVKVNIYRARQAVKQKFQEIDNYGL